MFCFERQLRPKAEENHGSWIVYNLFCILRALEFVGGLVAVGLYAQDLNGSSEQLFGVIVGIISAIASLVLIVPHFRPSLTFWLDITVFMLYVVLFAVFAKKYIGQVDPGLSSTSDKDVRLHHSVYVDAAEMILWFSTAVYSTLKFVRGYRARKSMGGPSEMEQIA